MAETQTELAARQLIRNGIALLMGGDEHVRTYQDVESMVMGELESAFEADMSSIYRGEAA